VSFVRTSKTTVTTFRPDSPPAVTDVASDILDVCTELADMLCAKNKAYGNSALAPLRCFAKSDVKEGLAVRIDDKLSRIMRGEEIGEDTVLDLLGYLVLWRVQERRAKAP
jgi:hypothetical protein